MKLPKDLVDLSAIAGGVAGVFLAVQSVHSTPLTVPIWAAFLFGALFIATAWALRRWQLAREERARLTAEQNLAAQLQQLQLQFAQLQGDIRQQFDRDLKALTDQLEEMSTVVKEARARLRLSDSEWGGMQYRAKMARETIARMKADIHRQSWRSGP